MKIRFLTLLSVVALFISCNKEDSAENKNALSPAEAKQAIENTMDNLYGCMRELNDGDFSSFFYDTFFITARTRTVTEHFGGYWDSNNNWVDYTYDRVEKSNWNKVLSDKWSKKYDQNVNIDGKFNFEGLKGTYTWDSSSEEWSKADNTNAIVLKFPANKDAKSNNAEFSLDYYTVKEVTYKNETVYLPVKSKATGKVDGKKVFEVEINNVTFKVNTNFSMPLTADIKIFTAPFIQNIKWQRKDEKTFELNYDIASAQGCTTFAKVEIKLNHSDYGNMTDLKKDVRRVNATVSHNDLDIVMSLDVAGLSSLNKDTYSVNEINKFYKGEVFYQKRKAADLTYAKDDKGEFSPELIYSDGSKEKARKYTQNFPDQVERIFKKYFDAEK